MTWQELCSLQSLGLFVLKLSTGQFNIMAPKKYILPRPLPDGCILTDSEKKNWRIGKIIGKGGFGLIYLGNDFIFCVKCETPSSVSSMAFDMVAQEFKDLNIYIASVPWIFFLNDIKRCAFVFLCKISLQ